jgi:hypothetical protein
MNPWELESRRRFDLPAEQTNLFAFVARVIGSTKMCGIPVILRVVELLRRYIDTRNRRDLACPSD